MKSLAIPIILFSISFYLLREARSDNYNDGVNAALQATYIQSGTKEKIDDYGKCLEHRYIKKEQEKYWAAFVYVANSVLHSEVEFRWTF